MSAALGRGVMVSNTPGIVIEETADMVMALILAATPRIPDGQSVMQASDWRGWVTNAFLGARVGGSGSASWE